MLVKIGELTIEKNKDYCNQLVKSLEDKGYVLVLTAETTFERYFDVADDRTDNERSK